MTDEVYNEVLKKGSDTLCGITSDVRIIGDGAGRFLSASLGNFGVELYAGDGEFVIDPSIGEELQGERTFLTIEEALRYATDWLTQKR